MRYLLLLLGFFLINCNSAKNKTTSNKGAAISYNKTKNVTYITNHLAIDTISLPGQWKEIEKLKNGSRINYHYYGLENTNNKDQIELATSPYRKSGYFISGTDIKTYTRQMAQHKLGLAELENKKMKQHLTDNNTFYTFSHTEDNLFRYSLTGGRGEYQFNINYYPEIVNEDKNIDYLVHLFKNIKP